MKKILKNIIFVFLFINSYFVYAQNHVFTINKIFPVSLAGVAIANPWTGGLNNAQIFKIELDGINGEDIIIFDKYANRILTYIYDGANYIYTPKFEYLFPTITNWLTIIDYDGDGKKDIFTSAGDDSFFTYVKVYKNNSTTNSIAGFTKTTTQLNAETRLGSKEVYVSNSEIPAVLDLDNDNDIDIVVYDAQGGASSLSFYRNRSMEDGTILGLNYEKYTSCWGKFSISSNCNNLTTTITNCRGFTGITDNLRMMHNGSTVAIIDLNGDGIKDILLGDTSCPNLYLLTNTGSNKDAISDANEVRFPPLYPISITTQPMVSFVDINNDQKLDMVASGTTSPFESDFGNNTSSLIYYQNSSNTTIPAYNIAPTDFFATNTSIDFGFDSYPDFFDMDADGDMDILVGHKFSNISGKSVGLKLFENTGNATVPAFNLIDSDYLGLNTLLGHSVIKPRFADINKDGAVDLYFLCRESAINFNIKCILNSAAKNTPTSFMPSQIFTITANVFLGENSNIFLYDINNDNLLDLLVCKSDQGVLNYYHNSGSANVPRFDGANNIFGNMGYNQNHFGNIIALGKLSDSSLNDALLWYDNRGKIFIYPNFMNEKTNFITKDSVTIVEQIGHKNLGANTVLALADINADGKTDFLLGGHGGGLRLLLNNYTKPFVTVPSPIIVPTVVSNVANYASKNNIVLYPNPTDGLFWWHDTKSEFTKLEIIDMQGSWKEMVVLTKNNIHYYDTKKLGQGVYIVKLYTENAFYYSKINISK